MTEQEAITLFKTPITTYKQGGVIQKLLLKAAAVDQDLAAKRSLDTLEDTELRALLLSAYPEIKLIPSDYASVNPITDISAALLPFNRVVLAAINELNPEFPAETTALLKDYTVKESPMYYIAIATFVVMSMVLLEAEII